MCVKTPTAIPLQELHSDSHAEKQRLISTNNKDTGLECAASSRIVRSNPIKKLTCYLVVVVLLLSPISTAHSISVKTQGKLAIVAILGGVAILTKYLVRRDQKAAESFHAKLGPPERVTRFERGFDQWRIEWYENRKYVYRNNVLQKETDTKPAEIPEAF